MSKPFLSLAMAGTICTHKNEHHHQSPKLVSLLAGLNVALTQRQSTETYTDPILVVMNYLMTFSREATRLSSASCETIMLSFDCTTTSVL
jgi:hypothetical protein